jgi:hypothetical protein
VSVTVGSDPVYNHLVALRSSLSENRWMCRVEAPTLAVFNELRVAAQELAPDRQMLWTIEPPSGLVSAATLLMLVDQMLVALSSR